MFDPFYLLSFFLLRVIPSYRIFYTFTMMLTKFYDIEANMGNV